MGNSNFLEKRKGEIGDQTIERLHTTLSPKYINNKELEKKFNSLVHQIWGSYYTSRPNFKKLLKKFDETPDKEEYLKSLLQVHSSTKERLGIYTQFYEQIFALTGVPSSLCDIGCGFNPLFFAINHSLHSIDARFIDIDVEEIEFINKVFDNLGLEKFKAEVGDVFNIPKEFSDIVLMLKLLPVIEQQERGASVRILNAVNAKYLVISFPTRSIGGKNKNMEENYSNLFVDIVGKTKWSVVKEISFDSELVFICKTKEEI